MTLLDVLRAEEANAHRLASAYARDHADASIAGDDVRRVAVFARLVDAVMDHDRLAYALAQAERAEPASHAAE